MKKRYVTSLAQLLPAIRRHENVGYKVYGEPHFCENGRVILFPLYKKPVNINSSVYEQVRDYLVLAAN